MTSQVVSSSSLIVPIITNMRSQKDSAQSGSEKAFPSGFDSNSAMVVGLVSPNTDL